MVLGANNNGPGRTGKGLPPLLLMKPSGTETSFGVSQVLPLGSQSGGGVHQRTRAWRTKHGVPMRTPSKQGSRWTRG